MTPSTFTDISALWDAVANHKGTLAIVFAALFLVSEFIGQNARIKASSVYGVVMAVLQTLKDQLLPQPVAVPAAAPTNPPTAQ